MRGGGCGPKDYRGREGWREARHCKHEQSQKKQNYEGGKEGRRWDTSVMTRNPRSVNCQWKCTQTVGLNEATGNSLAQWCAFPQVAEMLTNFFFLSWPGVWGFLCRVSWITNMFPSGAHFTSNSSLTHGDTPAGTNVQSSSGEAQLRVYECVLQRPCDRTNRRKC